jgi:hypothetical protein
VLLVDEGECAMKPTTKKVGLVIGVVGAILAAGVAVGALTNRGAPITRFDGVDEVIESCTATTTYKTIPQMTRTFNVSGGTASVAVMFSGAFTLGNSVPFDTGFFRLTIDNQEQTPGEVPAVPPNSRGTRSFNWQTAPLTAGSHTARVQWRTDQGNQFCVDARSLLVLHR